MIIKRLEFEFNDSGLSLDTVKSVAKDLCGYLTGSSLNLGVEIIDSAERGFAPLASNEIAFCRIIGNDDTVVAAMRALEGKLNLHASLPGNAAA